MGTGGTSSEARRERYLVGRVADMTVLGLSVPLAYPFVCFFPLFD